MCPLIPHWAAHYCSHVRWSYEYLCVVSACAACFVLYVLRISFPVILRGLPSLFCLGTSQCFVYVFVLGVFKTQMTYSCTCLQILYTSVTTGNICTELKGRAAAFKEWDFNRTLIRNPAIPSDEPSNRQCVNTGLLHRLQCSLDVAGLVNYYGLQREAQP